MYYKLGLIKTLIDRIYKICCDRKTFDLEIKKVREYLCKNSYPPHLIDKQLNKYIDKKDKENVQGDKIKENKNIFYLKLPFIGTYSKFV